MIITSPSYSFVKFGAVEAINNCCDGDQDFCIPVIEEDDTYFQAIITSDVYAEITAMMAAPNSIFHLLLLEGATNTEDDFTVLRDWALTNELTFEKYRTGLFEITLQWRSPLVAIKDLLDCGDCFQLGIARVIPTEFSGEFTDEFTNEFSVGGSTVIYDFITISNCFKRSCADCFTTVLEYYNDDDYAEFNYCYLTNPVNRVRLPFYLLQPKITEDKAVYRKSNGVVKQTKSLLTKEYQVLTEHYPEHIHDKFTVALAHDNVYVISGPYIGGISKSGEYAIEWSDNDCTAPASFKALATPYAIRNNNCQDCSEEIELCTAPVVPEFTFPEANVGEVFSHSETITGYQPFTLTPINTPVWMTITLVDDLLTFSGTPTTEGDIDVIFSISNLCTAPITITKTLNIENMVPGTVDFWGGLPGAIPTGWLLCDGSDISRTTYAALFAAIGTLHGPGDGTTTFNLPNIGKLVVAGYDAGDVEYNTVGGTGGANTVTITDQNMAHTHTYQRYGAAGSGIDGDDGPNDFSYEDVETSSVGNPALPRTPIDIRNSYYVLPYKIKF